MTETSCRKDENDEQPRRYSLVIGMRSERERAALRAAAAQNNGILRKEASMASAILWL